MLIERARSCLLVIDVQDCFLDKLPEDARAPLVARIGWLVQVARALEIPIIATAEDIRRRGSLVRKLPTMVVHDKLVFGLYDQADLRAAVDRTARRDMILTGLETDVCIAHSALGLLAAGYRVAVIEDAVASPGPDHGRGLRRIAEAGAILTSVKGIYYEWVRDVATSDRVEAALAGPLPPGVTL